MYPKMKSHVGKMTFNMVVFESAHENYISMQSKIAGSALLGQEIGGQRPGGQ